MKTLSRWILPAVLLSAAVAHPLTLPVQAQQVSQFHGSSRGRGSLSIKNDRSRLNSVRLDLNSGGRVTVRLDTSDGDYDISGRWQSGRSDIDIQLERFNNRETLSGTARAILDKDGGDYRLAKFEINGTILRRGEVLPVAGEFEIENGNSGGGWGGVDEVNTTLEGNGYWTQAGRPGQNLRSMKVSLSRNGRAQLEAYLDHTFVFAGTWRQNGDWADIDLTHLNGFPATGQARVSLRGRGFDRVTANGNGNGGRFSLDFNVRNSGGGNGAQNGDYTTSGRGLLTRPGDADAFTSAHVRFDGDRVSIELNGPRSYTFTGTYRQRGNEYKIRVSGNVGGQNVDGDGEIVLRRDNIRTIHIDGRMNNGSFKVDFDG